MLPARMCSPASSGSITMMSTWPPSSAAMRSPPPGNDMKAQRAPVDFCKSCRTTLSRLVFEPPDCLSCPGFFFAASMNSASVLYGASAFTAITAGSRTRRAIGVKSRSVTLASALTSGVCSHTPVKRPSVFWSPLFSARWAAATAALPPGLLITCRRTGSSFSFSTMTAIARASTSLPPPGPVCTTRSTVRAGLNPCAQATDAHRSAANVTRLIRNFMDSSLFLLERLQAPLVESAEHRDQQDQDRQRQHHRRDRPGHQDSEAAFGHHQRLAQRAFHAGAERETQDKRRRGVVELAHKIPEQAEHHEEREIEHASRYAVYAHHRHPQNEGIEDVHRHPQHLREKRHQRQVEDEQHDVADVHARHQAPEKRGMFGDEKGPRLESPQHQRREQYGGGARSGNAEREQGH